MRTKNAHLSGLAAALGIACAIASPASADVALKTGVPALKLDIVQVASLSSAYHGIAVNQATFQTSTVATDVYGQPHTLATSSENGLTTLSFAGFDRPVVTPDVTIRTPRAAAVTFVAGKPQMHLPSSLHDLQGEVDFWKSFFDRSRRK